MIAALWLCQPTANGMLSYLRAISSFSCFCQAWSHFRKGVEMMFSPVSLSQAYLLFLPRSCFFFPSSGLVIWVANEGAAFFPSIITTTFSPTCPSMELLHVFICGWIFWGNKMPLSAQLNWPVVVWEQQSAKVKMMGSAATLSSFPGSALH